MTIENQNHRATSVFRLNLDRDRPYVLDGEFSEDSAVIRYIYTDTGERITVTNSWFNRPAGFRAAHARRQAERSEKKAIELTENPPAGLCGDALECVIKRHCLNAERYWKEHDQIMMEPGATYQGGKPIKPEKSWAA